MDQGSEIAIISLAYFLVYYSLWVAFLIDFKADLDFKGEING